MYSHDQYTIFVTITDNLGKTDEILIIPQVYCQTIIITDSMSLLAVIQSRILGRDSRLGRGENAAARQKLVPKWGRHRMHQDCAKHVLGLMFSWGATNSVGVSVDVHQSSALIPCIFMLMDDLWRGEGNRFLMACCLSIALLK